MSKERKIYMNGRFIEESEAKISIFDSALMFGDMVFEMTRSFNKKHFKLKEHLDRLYKDAKLIDLKIHLTRKKLSEALIKTIQINKMKTDVHLRIIVSRGIKSTPYQSPKVTISKPTIIIIPEYKKPDIKAYKKGLKLVTVKTIRGPINVQNPQINSLSKLNCILACIEANKKNADEALMFDINGNVATNNSTHFFFVKNNTVFTSTGKYCVTGITRQKIIDLCKKNKIKVKEKNFKLKEVLNADEAFCTGSFAGIVPVNQINKKKYSLKKNPITKELTNFYNNLF